MMVVSTMWETESRIAYVFPDGTEPLVLNLKSTFTCDDRPYGYYADVDNVFHVCQPVVDADS